MLDHVCPGSFQMSGGRAKGERWGARDQSLQEAFAWPPLEPAHLDSTFPDGGPFSKHCLQYNQLWHRHPKDGTTAHTPLGGAKQVPIPLGQSGCK